MDGADGGIMRQLLMLAASVLLSCAVLAQPADPLVPEGATVKLGNHTYAIPDQNVGAVPNVGIVVGARATLVIDPGLGRRNGEAILREVAKVSDNDALYIVSTHYHPEHTTGYVAFPDSAVYINSRIQEEEFAENGAQTIARFASRAPAWGELLADAERRVADITFERDYSLDLGGVVVRMVVVGPTHTRGDTGFFVEGDRVLFSGDVVMNESFLGANDGSSIAAWLAAFDTFEAMGPRVIVPAHGPVGDASLIPMYRTLIEDIRATAIDMKAAGRSDDEAAEAAQARWRSEHPSWPRLNGVGALARVAWREAP
jgi:glyoxylase-like metal-dependent hydrolase (beta-lactamase superfamily II)